MSKSPIENFQSLKIVFVAKIKLSFRDFLSFSLFNNKSLETPPTCSNICHENEKFGETLEMHKSPSLPLSFTLSLLAYPSLPLSFSTSFFHSQSICVTLSTSLSHYLSTCLSLCLFLSFPSLSTYIYLPFSFTLSWYLCTSRYLFFSLHLFLSLPIYTSFSRAMLINEGLLLFWTWISWMWIKTS